jgi:Ni/Co efflux regulator RcnB
LWITIHGVKDTMKKSRLLTLALSAALASLPIYSFAAPPQEHKAAHPTYHFRAQDKAQLQPHYRAAHPHPSNGHRWAWHRGVNLPSGWQGEIEPLPQVDIALLAPPPPGYEFGYFDGWAIVYDPNTGIILDAVLVE